MEFIDYISKVAPVGETCLLVKQKPVGSEQHADGTIKATWPAFYPNEYKEGGAWYCNTASFITVGMFVGVGAHHARPALTVGA